MSVTATPKDNGDILCEMHGLTQALSIVSNDLEQSPIHDEHLSRLRSAVVGISRAMSASMEGVQ